MALTSASSRRVRRVGWGQRLSRWDIRLSPYLYISPFFILFAVFGAFPLVFNIVVALHDWHRRAGMGEFVGLDNFAWVLQQQLFWRSLENTISIFLLGGIPQLILALLIASVLDQNLRARTFWRMLSIFPLYAAAMYGSSTTTEIARAVGTLPRWLPTLHLFENFWQVFTTEQFDFWLAFANSLLVAAAVSASVVFFSTLAGFSFAKLRFRGSQVLYVAVLATLIIPAQVGTVPLFVMMTDFGWIDSLLALVVPGSWGRSACSG